MIDTENYKAAIAWLRHNLAALQAAPDDPAVQFALLQSFEVTYNLSEAILRQAYVSLGIDDYAAHVSLRELIWRASEEGLVLSCRKDWLHYGLALETMSESINLSVPENSIDSVQLLSRFAEELDKFARCLERRLVSHA